MYTALLDEMFYKCQLGQIVKNPKESYKML